MTPHGDDIFNKGHIHVDHFYRLVKYFKDNFNVISLEDMLRNHSKTRNSKINLCITFDDGYLNNFTVAAPILHDLKLPATFYIVTRTLEDPSFILWTDVVDYALLREYRRCKFSFGDFSNPEGYDPVQKLFLRDYIKKSGSRIYRIIDEIMAEIPTIKNEIKEFDFLIKTADKDTLRAASANRLFTFGSHSHSHYCMAYLNEEELRQELTTSKQILEDTLGTKVETIAYPDGSYNEGVIKLTLETGYRQGLIVDFRLNERTVSLHYKPRFSISNTTNY
ncbi:MAG: polysaccharide deacetylase family protein [Chitinophagales bacterium]|nr:polysaccharide deacetylase family protein [Chitinophagales bacterium]MDW8419620.1 polysaccharide deacetylase family protein [Chitinophagales bacterium]